MYRLINFVRTANFISYYTQKQQKPITTTTTDTIYTTIYKIKIIKQEFPQKPVIKFYIHIQQQNTQQLQQQTYTI